jgi:ribosome-associated toxin RatA of RatAB toxin-antitoxin module
MRTIFILIYLVLLTVMLTTMADSKAADNSLHNKPADLPKIEYMRNIEGPQEKITMSEEERNHKTFQVAKVMIKARPEAVFDTFTDYKRAPAIFSYCKQSQILSSVGPDKKILFEAAIAGGLIKFDYILEFREYRPKLIEWHRVSGAFKANEGYWKFEPTDDGKATLVTYSKYVDAGFPFPQFIVKKELRNDMPVILTELKTAVEGVN